MAAIFRKFLPGVEIIDAVETLDLGGGIDIWVPKQDTYEKWRNDFELLQKAGEKMWFYTCAFPAGRIMNRSMDLPLAVNSALLWMSAGYGLTGFLHWGFNYYLGDDIWTSACCPHKGRLLPAGDAHIVYPGNGCVLPSMRLETQRNGAEDYELLIRLKESCPQQVNTLIARVCTNFRDYTADAGTIEEARIDLLRYLH